MRGWKSDAIFGDENQALSQPDQKERLEGHVPGHWWFVAVQLSQPSIRRDDSGGFRDHSVYRAETVGNRRSRATEGKPGGTYRPSGALQPRVQHQVYGRREEEQSLRHEHSGLLRVQCAPRACDRGPPQQALPLPFPLLDQLLIPVVLVLVDPVWATHPEQYRAVHFPGLEELPHAL